MSDFERVKDAQELIQHYSDEHWWFDPDCDIEETMQALLDMASTVQTFLDNYNNDRVWSSITPVREALAKLESER